MSANVTSAESVQEAVAQIDSFQWQADQLVLSLPESLFVATDVGAGQQVTGIAAAILTDRALGRGWLPIGSETVSGRRIWTFGEL